MNHSIPVIDVAPLFHTAPPARRTADGALAGAARDVGFVCIRGLPPEAALGSAARARLLAVFGLDEARKRRLYRRKFAPENPNVYRGWFPLQPGNLTSKEGLGDFLWKRMTSFVEFRGMERERSEKHISI